MKNTLVWDVLIVGGGLAGLSTAYHLAQGPGKLRIAVVEREKKLGGHSSGRNAGMIRQALSDPFLVRLAREGRESLDRAAASGAWKGLGLRAAGSLLLDESKNSVDLNLKQKKINFK